MTASLGIVLLGCSTGTPVSPNVRSTGPARQLYERAIRQKEEPPAARQPSARNYLEQGMTHEQQENDDAAIKAYTRAIAADPGLVDAYYRRALVYQRKELTAACIMDLDRVVSASPDFPNALYYRGIAYARLSKHEQAIQDLSQFIARADRNPKAYYERGKSYLALKDFERARRDFDQAIELDPDQASGYFYRGLTYYWEGHYNSAVLDYTRALLYDPNSLPNYVNRCWALALLGRAAKAKEDCDKALVLNPQSPHAHDASAFVLWQLGNKDGALAALAKARSLDSGFMAPRERYREFPIYLTKSLLRAAGYDPGTVDEKVDQRTRAAIEQFQRDRKLEVTGEVSDALLNALRKTKAARYLYEAQPPRD